MRHVLILFIPSLSAEIQIGLDSYRSDYSFPPDRRVPVELPHMTKKTVSFRVIDHTHIGLP